MCCATRRWQRRSCSAWRALASRVRQEQRTQVLDISEVSALQPPHWRCFCYDEVGQDGTQARSPLSPFCFVHKHIVCVCSSFTTRCPSMTCAASNACTMTRCEMFSFVWRDSRRHAKAMFPSIHKRAQAHLLLNHKNWFGNKRQRGACGLARRGFATRARSHGSGVGFANEGFDGVHFGDFKLCYELQMRSIAFELRGTRLHCAMQAAAAGHSRPAMVVLQPLGGCSSMRESCRTRACARLPAKRGRED